jgi:hypothetical protein
MIGQSTTSYVLKSSRLVGRDAPKQTVDFMELWLGKDIQTKFAAEDLSNQKFADPFIIKF